jgi:hypothetical protein
LATGVLRSIPYAEWRGMDDAFPFADSKYEQTAPVFLEVELGTDPSASSVEELHEAFQAQEDPGSVALATLYHGLLLATAVPLPQPSPAQMRDTSDLEIPESMPRATTRSSTDRVETPLT